MADRNKEALLEVRLCGLSYHSYRSGLARLTLTVECLCACVYLPGVFLRRLGVCAGDRGCPVAEGGWEEVVEEALLPPQGFRNLLCPQRQSQGQ